MAKTQLNRRLVDAYLKAEYHVLGGNDFILKVGQFSPELSALYRCYRCYTATFITAFNPFSYPLSVGQNRQHQQLLIDDIQTTGLHYIIGAGRDPVNQWPEESSVLVLGMDCQSSFSLAKKYQQNAILWCDKTAVPQLVVVE